MAGQITFTGLSSNMDLNKIIDGLVAARRRSHIEPLENWKTQWETKLESISTIDSALSSFYTAVRGMDRVNEFLVRSATSSNTNVLTASADSTATPGTHTVTVGSNINHRLATQGWVDQNSTAIGDSGGDFVIQVGTQGTITIADVDITGATTLQGLRDLINNDAENTGNKAVTASIINDGSGSTNNPYRLVITPVNGGPNYKITITKNPTKLNFYENDISPVNTSNLTATTTTAITTMGTFTEDKSVVGAGNAFRTYTFTGPVAQETVGSGTWSINWSGDNGGGTGALNLGSTYTPGSPLEIEDGVFIKFDAGIFEGGSKTFTVKAYSTDTDTVKNGTWSGTSTVTSDGNYLGTTNKTFNFTINGTGSKTVGTDPFNVSWADGEGNSGTVTVTAASTNYTVFQGVKVSFSAGTVTGGDTFSLDVFNATLQDGVSEGMAKAEKETHYGFPDTNSTAVTTTTQTLSYAYNGKQRTITVPAGTTLSGLKDLINNDSQNPGVTASISNDGTGLSTAYHLMLTGNQTGAAYKITSISHTLTNFSKIFTETQIAQNAMLKVDGYPSLNSEYIQKSSNHVTDAITGVTLDLVGAGTSTVTINTDASAIIAKAEDFKEAFNNVRTAIKQATLYNAETGVAGSLLGNYAIQIIKSKLDNLVAATAPGFRDPDDTYINLQQLGFSTDAVEGSETEGLLLLDTSVLSNALNTDPEAVANVFSAYLDGISNDNQIAFQSALSSTTPGIYDVEVDLDLGSGNYQKGRFKLASEVSWHPWVALSGTSGDYTLTGAAGYSEQGLALQITYPDGALHSSEIRLKNGVVTELSLSLEDFLSTSGPLNNIDESYNDIIDNIEKRIADEEERLNHYEESLRQRFARLDAYISEMNNIGNYLTLFTSNYSKK